MIMTTLEHEIANQQELVNASREEIALLREELRDLRADLKRGQLPDKGACPEIKRLGTMISHCLEMEKTLAKCKEQQAGIAQCGVAFDLDAAKCSIGSKLDRLRACHTSE